MSAPRPSPYDCHIFVCVNDRQGVRKSCADGGSLAVKQQLKAAVAARGWRSRVRVSQCGCMGLCAEGPNIILYPQKIWFSGVGSGDLQAILAAVELALAAAPPS
jgi:(2Fe-2S) ferredoxin